MSRRVKVPNTPSNSLALMFDFEYLIGVRFFTSSSNRLSKTNSVGNVLATFPHGYPTSLLIIFEVETLQQPFRVFTVVGHLADGQTVLLHNLRRNFL